MVLTSRRGFVKGAAASCIAFANLDGRGFDGVANPVFAYEFGDISPEQQAGFARQYGFDGTVFDHARQIPERLRALDEAHLRQKPGDRRIREKIYAEVLIPTSLMSFRIARHPQRFARGLRLLRFGCKSALSSSSETPSWTGWTGGSRMQFCRQNHSRLSG
jgi:hypothetical protein